MNEDLLRRLAEPTLAPLRAWLAASHLPPQAIHAVEGFLEDAVRRVMQPLSRPDGVFAASTCWIVTART